MLGGIRNTAALPELRRRLIFTFLMLAVYRIGVQIPTPGINGEALAAFFAKTGTRSAADSFSFPVRSLFGR